jgi:hypothetical protein
MIPTVTTADALDPPVTTQDLAEFLRADVTDPLLQPMLIAATDLAIHHIKRDLKTRNWVLEYWDWPTTGTKRGDGLSCGSEVLESDIKLLFSTNGNQSVVSSVLINGEASTGYTLQNDRVVFDYVAYTHSDSEKALQISYSTGYGALDSDVPQAIREAIKLIAGYIYSNRGCSVTDAIHKSGAGIMLIPFRSEESLI